MGYWLLCLHKKVVLQTGSFDKLALLAQLALFFLRATSVTKGVFSRGQSPRCCCDWSLQMNVLVLQMGGGIKFSSLGLGHVVFRPLLTLDSFLLKLATPLLRLLNQCGILFYG